MRRSNLILLVSPMFIVICVSLLRSAECTETAVVTVDDISICRDVVNLSCVDAGTVFTAKVGKLYCFTRICGAQDDIEIYHVWYFGEKERARVKLGIHSPNFRTYSSKIIQPHEVGGWHVDVMGPGGELLSQVQFEITPFLPAQQRAM